MMSMTSARALAVAILAASILATGSAAAQTYPDRPVTMLVAFPPGGADDAIARIIQDPLQKALGQPIVIENVGGAGGSSPPPGRHAPSPTATPSCCTRTRWRRP